MVLAAGLGTRMRPLTDTMPKALVPVAGRALIDYAIDRLAAVGVARVVVNVHYKAEMLVQHLKARVTPEIRISHEDEPLETGGGVLKALPLLDEVFYVVNSDVLWLNGKVPALERLARAWDERRLDALLLLQRTAGAVGYDGIGDFIVDPLGAIRRRGEREIAAHLFAGAEIMHRRLLEKEPPGKFSLNRVWDRAMAAGRLGAIVHDGEWFHVGTPRGLALTEERLRAHHIGR
jgi:MurNAc alpha-1-phosphate uridylyltransferase